MVRWVSTVVEGGAPYKRGSEGPRNRNDTGRDEGIGQAGKNTRRKRDTVRSRDKQLPHNDPAHIAKLQSRRHSATPELAALRRYTLANRGAYDLTTLSTLYAAAGMLKYASATLDQVYADKNAARPTALQWIELLEAGRQARDPIFAREMMNGIRGRDGRKPSKKMQQVLLNTYAESGMAREALQLYKEMAARHDADVSMAIAVLKGCIRRRDLPESFVDGVIDVIQEGNRPLPRRVKSMVLMAYASRDTDTVDRCFELAESLEKQGPLRGRDLLALLRACREAGDVERGDLVLGKIDSLKREFAADTCGKVGDDGQGTAQGNERQPGHAGAKTGDKEEEPFDVSLATEVCRFHFVAGRIDDAKATFKAVPFASRDLALYNVMVESLDDAEASLVFEEVWRRGLFGRRRRKLSSNKRVAHIDVHRLGLKMAERAIDKHLEDLRDGGGGQAGDTVKAVKVIVGKGKPTLGKTRLCEHVRCVLYEGGVAYDETSPCVFTVPLQPRA